MKNPLPITPTPKLSDQPLVSVLVTKPSSATIRRSLPTLWRSLMPISNLNG